MINADKALRIILYAAPAGKTEKVGLEKAPGRTAAENITAREPVPAFRNSSMDGYAVRSADLASASAEGPVVLRVAGESSAGNPFTGSFRKGSALRIMTGGKIPRGADAVVPVELVSGRGDLTVSFSRPALPGDFVRLPGEDIARGGRVIDRGDLLTPAHVGVLAATGNPCVRVAVPPGVAILATGDELVRPERKPGEGRIRNSSSYTLMALVREAGAHPVFLGIAKDRKKEIRRMVRAGLSSDLLLLTGGVSVGAHDHVREVLSKCGVEILFWRVNIRPGSPLLFGTAGRTLVFGLPGNPVSTGVTFLQFVRPAIRKMLGRSALFPSQFSALTDEVLTVKEGKRCYLRGVVRQEGGVLRVRTTGSQSSGVMSSLVKANCLIVIGEGTSKVPAGGAVTVEFLHDPL